MRPKKSLGQNFLKSAKALGDIVHAGDVGPDDIVLEIGPGKGALTEKLLETGATVIAVEKDRELVPFLAEKFSTYIASGKLTLIEADILAFNPSHNSLVPSHYKLIGNIPYYITGAIIRKFLESDYQPTLAVFLVQKEVAERIVARPGRSGDGKESILSLSVKAYGEPKMIGKVSKRYFTPEPKVDSAILLIAGINKNNFKNLRESDFFNVVKTAFGQKRKTLLKNLENLGLRKEVIHEILAQIGLHDKVRAEDLSLSAMLSISSALFPQKTDKKNHN
jgi:16S rRNA (adenine1518-N6/adenine1519-N6)-dimethyltransferase